MAENNNSGMVVGDLTVEQKDCRKDDSETEKQCSPDHEGKHMFRLRDALHKTVGKCIEKTSRYSMFAHNYKFAHKRNPQMLKSVVKQFNDNLKASIEAEFEQMIVEENLVSLCNDFDKMIEETSVPEERISAWRPSGIPKKDVRSHIMNAKLKERDALKKELEELEQEHERLQEVFVARTQHLLDAQKALKMKMSKWEEGVNVCTNANATNLQNLISSMLEHTKGSSD